MDKPHMTQKDELISKWVENPSKFYLAIKEFSDPKQKIIAEAILLLSDEIRNQSNKENILEVLPTIVDADHSPTLLFFFYLHWFAFDAIHQRVHEAKIVLAKIKTYAEALNSPDLTAEYLLREASMSEGKIGDQAFLKGLSLLKEGSGQYISNVNSLLDEFSQKGTLNDLDPKYIKATPIKLAQIFQFINSIEIGQIEEIQKLREHIPNHENLRIPTSLKERLKNAKRLFNIYLEIDDKEVSEHWALSTKALLNHNPTLALFHAKEFQMTEFNRPFQTAFPDFTLLRAELSNRNFLASKALLDNYRKRDLSYIFADFFYARLELLNNNHEKAIDHFRKVIETCNHYDATGRLDLELELANELKPKQIRLLMEGAFKTTKNQTPHKAEIKKETSFEKNDIGVERLKGKSTALDNVKDNVLQFSKLDIPILILGETGVGKDVIARAIHEESNRKDKPYIAINCSSIAESLLQSELFGHEAGAYTGATKAHKGIFQEAGEGTVFLDEIGDISKGMQAALLRVLESFEYRPVGSAKPRKLHCRIITATNAILENKVDAKEFRMDLLYRLKRMVIKVPPLRERPLDIKLLADHFLNLNKRVDDKTVMSKDLEEALEAYAWPGNVRELKNEIEKMRLLHSEKNSYNLEDAHFLKPDEKTTSNQEKNLEGLAIKSKIEPSKENKSFTNPTETPDELVFKGSDSYFRRINQIKSLFTIHQCMTRKELCQIIGVSNITIGNDIKKLISEGFIKRNEPTKSPRTHYFEIKKN